MTERVQGAMSAFLAISYVLINCKRHGLKEHMSVHKGIDYTDCSCDKVHMSASLLWPDWPAELLRQCGSCFLYRFQASMWLLSHFLFLPWLPWRKGDKCCCKSATFSGKIITWTVLVLIYPELGRMVTMHSDIRSFIENPHKNCKC